MLMCNRITRVLREPLVETEDTRVEMDSSTTLANTPGLVLSSNEDSPRLKLLCSFNGNILPRPQDGKLRYVGGETRIVSVPRDIGFEELMMRMKELLEGASVLKYQQPDEDLDALVSVVNDDDVTNMMEEYDKLGSGDGFTRLRIFLFSSPEQDDLVHFVDGDERDNERRYVDALNSLNDSPEFGKQQMNEFQGMAPVDDIQVTDQYFNHLNIEGSVHNQRNFEMPMTPVNLHQPAVPHLGSLQRQRSLTQRYAEMESPWSPACYSPRHPGNDFPASPSYSPYPYGEQVDRGHPENYFSQQHNNHLPQYDHQPQLPENVAWLPPAPISGDKAGFPGNILQGRPPSARNQAPDLPNLGNGFHQVGNPCVECPPGREAYVPNLEVKIPHPFYGREQNDPRSFYNEAHSHERGWRLQHQSNPRTKEPRSHNHGSRRLSDHYIVESNGMRATAYADDHHVPSHYVHHEDHPHYTQHGPEFGNELFHDQPMVGGSPHVHIPHEEHGVRYGNFPYAYGPENLYHTSSQGHVPANAFWRNVQNPVRGPPSNEASSLPHQENGTCNLRFIRTRMESTNGPRVGVENQNPLVESSLMAGFDVAGVPDYSHNHSLTTMPNSYNLENQHHIPPEPVQFTLQSLRCSNPIDLVVKSDPAPTFVDNKVLSLKTLNIDTRNGTSSIESARKIEGKDGCEGGEQSNVEADVKDPAMFSIPSREQNTSSLQLHEGISSNCLPAEKIIRAENSHEDNALASLKQGELEIKCIGYVPQSIDSVKKAALEDDEVKGEAQEIDASTTVIDAKVREETAHELDVVDATGDLEVDSDSENHSDLKIEPTKAEEEAIAKGLQTIKNDDLEEIRELGSGTYGAVYHGKWKGSDVAIKRIKASCFAGRPSERERLIAEFWREALILSSLHHPNVVSFYGIVRDGPDGSLATVTEFMINGSLKQFLQKKDRTIDRRKRLIIAMDAAFGMEYLHGKNIVHFDLKCENLLVNMRDPQRPICKIGDLGLSKVKQHTLVSGGVRGTLPWMAPELLSGKSHMVTEKIDVYSFGIVMWELLTGDEPYGDMHCASIIGGIVNNLLRPTIPTWCDPEWKSLMGSCWSAEPAQRPSFSEISQKLRTMAAAINVK